MSKAITKAQLRKLHTIRRQYPQYVDADAWHDYVYSFTDGRTNTSTMLTWGEAAQLIDSLDESNSRMRKKIYAICSDLGWFQSKSSDDLKINWGVIDLFLSKRGVVKKPLRKCNHKELVQVVSQFESIRNKGIDFDIQRLLNESGIGKETA